MAKLLPVSEPACGAASGPQRQQKRQRTANNGKYRSGHGAGGAKDDGAGRSACSVRTHLRVSLADGQFHKRSVRASLAGTANPARRRAGARLLRSGPVPQVLPLRGGSVPLRRHVARGGAADDLLHRPWSRAPLRDGHAPVAIVVDRRRGNRYRRGGLPAPVQLPQGVSVRPGGRLRLALPVATYEVESRPDRRCNGTGVSPPPRPWRLYRHRRSSVSRPAALAGIHGRRASACVRRRPVHWRHAGARPALPRLHSVRRRHSPLRRWPDVSGARDHGAAPERATSPVRLDGPARPHRPALGAPHPRPMGRRHQRRHATRAGAPARSRQSDSR